MSDIKIKPAFRQELLACGPMQINRLINSIYKLKFLPKQTQTRKQIWQWSKKNQTADLIKRLKKNQAADMQTAVLLNPTNTANSNLSKPKKPYIPTGHAFLHPS